MAAPKREFGTRHPGRPCITGPDCDELLNAILQARGAMELCTRLIRETLACLTHPMPYRDRARRRMQIRNYQGDRRVAFRRLQLLRRQQQAQRAEQERRRSLPDAAFTRPVERAVNLMAAE